MMLGSGQNYPGLKIVLIVYELNNKTVSKLIEFHQRFMCNSPTITSIRRELTF